ncbi:hypothetical protein D3C84_915730 [compost metagenome]
MRVGTFISIVNDCSGEGAMALPALQRVPISPSMRLRAGSVDVEVAVHVERSKDRFGVVTLNSALKADSLFPPSLAFTV